MSKLDMSVVQLSEETRNYYNDFRKNGVTTIRFGQLICNKYLREGESFPTLYYETQTDKAFDRALHDIKDRVA